MTENHFRMHFSPFQINMQLSFNFFFQNGRRPLFIAFLAISINIIQLFLCNFLWIFFQNGSLICAKDNRVLPLCVINGYAKYEVDR